MPGTLPQPIAGRRSVGIELAREALRVRPKLPHLSFVVRIHTAVGFSGGPNGLAFRLASTAHAVGASAGRR